MTKTQRALLTRDELTRRMVVPGPAKIRTEALHAHAEVLLKPRIDEVTLNKGARVHITPVFEEDLGKEETRKTLPQEFKGKPGQVYVATINEPREIYVGVGSRDKFDTEAARVYGARAVREAQKLRSDSVSVRINGVFKEGKFDEVLEAVVFGATLAAYRFENKLAVPVAQRPVDVKRFDIDYKSDLGTADVISTIRRACLLADCQNSARYLSDMDAEKLNPLSYALLLQQIAHTHGIPFARIRPNELASMGLNGIATVGRAAKYRGSIVLMGHLTAEIEPIVLVGKGLTMDTGGYDTKAPGTMGDMFFDMEGSAAVSMAELALSQIGIRNTVAMACIADNRVDGNAYVSGTIIRVGGRTFEVKHTDAEGRIVLADGLSLAANLIDPDVKDRSGSIISIATLTGAACRALGSGIAAAGFSTEQELVDAISVAAKATGEPVHFFDIHPSLAELIKGERTDLVTIANNGGEAGQTTAAAFLSEFVMNYQKGADGRKTRYAHIDMAPMMDAHAGPSAKDPRYVKGNNALGYGVNLLVETVKRLRG